MHSGILLALWRLLVTYVCSLNIFFKFFFRVKNSFINIVLHHLNESTILSSLGLVSWPTISYHFSADCFLSLWIFDQSELTKTTFITVDDECVRRSNRRQMKKKLVSTWDRFCFFLNIFIALATTSYARTAFTPRDYFFICCCPLNFISN